jgi:hypothetical protein
MGSADTAPVCAKIKIYGTYENGSKSADFERIEKSWLRLSGVSASETDLMG